MAKYNLTNKAVEDLSKIWYYTFGKWSERQADKYYEMLIANCEKISENPGLGKGYDGITKNLLGLRTNRYIIFYRKIEGEDIEIIRISHERMDLKNRIVE